MELHEAFNLYEEFEDEILDDACFDEDTIAKCIVMSYGFINKFGHTQRADTLFLECMKNYMKEKEL